MPLKAFPAVCGSPQGKRPCFTLPARYQSLRRDEVCSFNTFTYFYFDLLAFYCEYHFMSFFMLFHYTHIHLIIVLIL